MPTYDYECECGYKELRLLPMSDAPKIKECPKCKKETLIKLVGTSGGFTLKGEGFYKKGGF